MPGGIPHPASQRTKEMLISITLRWKKWSLAVSVFF